jgi:hypothetical protein
MTVNGKSEVTTSLLPKCKALPFHTNRVFRIGIEAVPFADGALRAGNSITCCVIVDVKSPVIVRTAPRQASALADNVPSAKLHRAENDTQPLE